MLHEEARRQLELERRKLDASVSFNEEYIFIKRWLQAGFNLTVH